MLALAAALAVLYLEDLVVTPVTLQLVGPRRRAFLVAIPAALTIWVASYRMVTAGLLASGASQVTLAAAFSSIAQLLLAAIGTASCGMLLAYSAGAGQWLTEQSPNHNVVQWQALYGVLAALSAFTAASLLADLHSDTLVGGRAWALASLSGAS